MLLLADPWLHNLDPFAIQIGGFVGDLLNGGVRWYGLSYLVGFAIGFFIIKRVLSVGISPLKPQQAADLVVTIAIGIVLGGRLGYVVFYQPSLLLHTEPSFPFWGVFQINKGGMASHGGMLGGIAGCLFFAWRAKLLTPNKFAHTLDLMAFGAPLGLLCGRIANFINGELIGRSCPRDFPLAVQFPQEISETWSDAQIAELNLAPVTVALPPDLNKYQLTNEAVQQVQAGNEAWIAYMAEHLTPRYPSQLFAGLTEGVIVFAILLWLYRKPVKAGLIGGVFCMSYALMRVVNEFFRRPDAQFIEEGGKLPLVTQGQLLSIGLFVLGVVTVVLALRSKSDKLGGWMKAKAD